MQERDLEDIRLTQLRKAMQERDLKGIINALNETQSLSHSDEGYLLADMARDMMQLVAIRRQGEEKLKQLLEKLQNKQTSLLEKMLTTVTNITSSAEMIKVLDTEEVTEELRLALERVDREKLRLALKRAESLQMEEFEVFKKAELVLRLQFLCVCQYIS